MLGTSGQLFTQRHRTGTKKESTMSQQRRIAPPSGFPHFGWTEDSTKQYIIDKPLAIGDPMIIYNGQAGMHNYVLAQVQNPSLGKQRRVLLSKAGAYGGALFYRSGKNCFAPTGKTRMLPPVHALMIHLAEDVDVWLEASSYNRCLIPPLSE